jgi:signal transduction histidine kinase
LFMTALVGVAVCGLSVLHLTSEMYTWIAHAAERGAATAQVVKRDILSRAGASMAALASIPSSYSEREVLWTKAIANDIELPQFLTEILAQSRSVVEISIAGPDNRILASSNPSQAGRPLVRRPSMREFASLGPFERFRALLWQRGEYEDVAILAEQERRTPLFTIQVITPIALLRDYMKPRIQRMVSVSLLALLLATVFAYFAAQIAYRPLTRIGQAIERLASGDDVPQEEMQISSANEYALVQQKLRLLGEQIRGAQAGASDLRGGVQQLLDRLETATLLFDRQGHLTMASPAAERLLARNGGRPARSTFHEFFPTLRDHAWETRARGLMVGSLRVDLDPLPGGGALVRLSDPSGRQLLESQLNMSSRLAAISRLTGRVAHEIKNPLNAIALQLEVLKEIVLDEVPAAKPRLDELLAEIMRLDRVVRTFLDFTRPVELETEPFDLCEVTGSLLSLIEAECESARVQIERAMAQEPVMVRGDASLLRQAILNILRNALESMPEGGFLRVAVDSDDAALLSITDTGVGIAPEDREKIFQLYFTTKEQGTGVGLAMAYRAVQLHGGTVEVDSEPGKGTTMRIRLPLLTAKEVTA